MMNSKKQICRKLVETLLHRYVKYLIKLTDNPTVVIQLFESWAALAKLNQDTVVKAVQYYMQLDHKFKVSLRAPETMMILLGINTKDVFSISDINKNIYYKMRKDREMLMTFVYERCTPPVFQYETDLILAKYLAYICEHVIYNNAAAVRVANELIKILEDDEDAELEI